MLEVLSRTSSMAVAIGAVALPPRWPCPTRLDLIDKLCYHVQAAEAPQSDPSLMPNPSTDDG